ncbi:MAG: Gfo/Idh/MocA family oxidoreductase [Actinomycetota bacterium]|nr:Gfo/Idh/MocA family oxidoreductase [Actinomycetota bacterium]
MSALRVAVVGTGWIAGKHLAALTAQPGVEVVAVADAVRERAEEVAGSVGARAYDDGLTLLAEEELDAVWLCVPPFAHGPLEQAAVSRSLPFFVEKPLALDLDTAVEVAAGVRERGLLTAVGYHWRHLDVVEQARAVLQSAPAPAQLLNGFWLDRTPPAAWWRRRGRSGGQVLEQTTHVFDLARVLVGEVDQVFAVESATPRAAFPDADAPTASVATLHFTSGALGTISSTCVLGWRHRVGVHVLAESTAVELVERSLVDHELRVVTGAGDTAVTTSDEDPVAREDREFLAAVRGEVAQVTAPYEDALRTHALAYAADRAAREGVPVRPADLLRA